MPWPGGLRVVPVLNADPATTLSDQPEPARRIRFFVAGVPKAGTTALCQFLAQHPQIFMCPIKEPTFFAARELLAFEPEPRRAIEAKARAVERWFAGETPDLPESGFALEWPHYEGLFRGVREHRAIGEGSVSYWWAPGAPSAIRERFPNARFVIVLRDPADRFFSEYRSMRWSHPLYTFRDCIAFGLEGRDGWGRALDHGRYGTHLERLFSHFPREQFSIHLYEDFCANPQAVCRDILIFLGVDGRPLNVSKRVHEPRLPRFPRLQVALRYIGRTCGLSKWLPLQRCEPLRRVLRASPQSEVVSAADRRVLLEHYRGEIQKAAELLDRDLSSWLR